MMTATWRGTAERQGAAAERAIVPAWSLASFTIHRGDALHIGMIDGSGAETVW
jgi:hypothetical protein